jgi:hypothetical protein
LHYSRPSGVRAPRVDQAHPSRRQAASAASAGTRGIERLEGRTLMSVSLDASGFTVVGASADTQVIYVSSSGGNDAHDGRSQNAAVKSIARGRSLLRNGMPDHMLLKRGDTWYEPLSPAEWTLSGRDADEPMLVSSYGDAGAARPLLKTGAKRGFDLNGKPVHDLVIKGLHFQAHTRDPDAPEYTGNAAGSEGVRLVGAARRLLVEDNYVESYAQNISVMDWNGRPADVTLRRNVVADAYPTSAGGKAQGLYVDSADRVTIEGNLFDHNGWDERVGFAVASQYNHNVYIQNTTTGIVVRGNVVANGSSHGVQARSGGEVRDNLFLRNAVGLSFGMVNGAELKAGGVTGTVDGNVFLDSHDINGVSRGWGVEINNTQAGANVGIRDNIFAHDTRGTGAAIRLDVGAGVSNAAEGVGINDLTVEDNVVYKWHQGLYTNNGFVNGGTGLTGYNNVTVRNNDFQQMAATKMARHGHAVSTAEDHWSGNRYADSNLSTSEWFDIGGTRTPLETWRSKMEPTAQNAAGAYADPNRTISTYNASLGGEASLAGYLREARKQRQGNFRPAYTSAAAINYVRRGFAEGGVIPGGEVAVPGGSVAPVVTEPAPTPDTAAPTVASYAAAAVTAAGTDKTFTVTYRDDRAMGTGSIGAGDVLVTGANGYSQAGTLVTAQASADGLGVTAQYRVPAAGGTWDAADNGTYTLSVRANEVKDVAGNAAAAGTLGSFAVTVAAAAPAPAPTPPPTSGTATVLRAAADSYVRDGTYEAVNYGTAAEIIVKKAGTAGSNRETYLRFDLSSVSTITSAKLRLFGRLANTNDASVTTTVYDAADTTWSESGLAWKGKPAAGATSRGTITVSGTTGKWYELDLTAFLAAQKAAGRNAVTLVLKNGSTSNAEVKFTSDEALGNRPELVIA